MAKEEFGFAPEYSLEDGVKDYIEWLDKNKDWWIKRVEAEEVRRKALGVKDVEMEEEQKSNLSDT